MDVPFLQSIDGHWKQLKKWTLQKVTSAPEDSVEGGVWYNETSKRIEVDVGSENKEVAYVGESAEHNSLLKKDGGDTINNYYGHVKQIHNNILDNFGKASGAIVSDANNYIPIEQIPVGLLGGLTPKGAWNPSTNTPSLSNPPLATTRGWFYIASTSGTALGTDWASGDWCISDGTVWQKIDNTDKVSSVFGRTGSVVAASGDYNLDQINDGTTYKRITSTEKTNYNTAYTHSQSTGNSHSIVASQIPSTATGDVAATNVQAAIAELASEKVSTSVAATNYLNKTTTSIQKVAGEVVFDNFVQYKRTPSTDAAFFAGVNGEAYNRFALDADGKMHFGGGTADRDTELYRASANVLTTPDNFKALSLDKHGGSDNTALTGNVQTQINKCFSIEPGTIITPTTDLNTITSPGSYRCYSNVPFVSTYNQPVGAYNFGQLRVYGGTDGQIYQEYLSNKSDNYNTGVVWRRRKYASAHAWSAWKRDISQDDIDGKQNILTFDSTPTAGSSNPVKSDGIYNSIRDGGRVITEFASGNGGFFFLANLSLDFYTGAYSYGQAIIRIVFNGGNVSVYEYADILINASINDGVFNGANATVINTSQGMMGRIMYVPSLWPQNNPSSKSLYLAVSAPQYTVVRATVIYSSSSFSIGGYSTGIACGDNTVINQSQYVATPDLNADDSRIVNASWVKDVAAPINATLTNEPARDVLPTGSYAITAILQWFRNNLSQLFTSVAGKAPISHASTATTYGVSSATNYGHAMASSAAPAMDGPASAGPDNGKFTREGHVHPSDTSRATRAKNSVVALSSMATMSSVVDGTTYTLPQYGTATLPANVGSIGDRVYFTVTGCSAGPITVNGLQKNGGQGVSGIIAEKCALGWCVC